MVVTVLSLCNEVSVLVVVVLVAETVVTLEVILKGWQEKKLELESASLVALDEMAKHLSLCIHFLDTM